MGKTQTLKAIVASIMTGAGVALLFNFVFGALAQPGAACKTGLNYQPCFILGNPIAGDLFAGLAGGLVSIFLLRFLKTPHNLLIGVAIGVVLYLILQLL